MYILTSSFTKTTSLILQYFCECDYVCVCVCVCVHVATSFFLGDIICSILNLSQPFCKVSVLLAIELLKLAPMCVYLQLTQSRQENFCLTTTIAVCDES